MSHTCDMVCVIHCAGLNHWNSLTHLLLLVKISLYNLKQALNLLKYLLMSRFIDCVCVYAYIVEPQGTTVKKFNCVVVLIF